MLAVCHSMASGRDCDSLYVFGGVMGVVFGEVYFGTEATDARDHNWRHTFWATYWRYTFRATYRLGDILET